MTKFFCPHCNGILSVNNQIVMTVKNDSKKGLVFLSQHLGDYNIWHHPDFVMKEGERFDFYCPICGATLTVNGSESLAQIGMEEDGQKFIIVFSRIKGEHCTYKIKDQNIEARFGEHSESYIDFVSALFYK